jgi:hypothetical protein
MSFWTFHNEERYSAACYAQGLAMQFAQVSLFCWTGVFAFNLYMVIVMRRLDVHLYNTWYHSVCWIVAVVCTLIPNFTFAYGRTTVWCWISKEAPGGNAYRIGTFFVPFYVSWIIMLFVCICIVYRLLITIKHMLPDEKERTLQLVRRFYAYPIIFLICYIPATINRINNWVTGNDVFVLFIIHVLASPSLGTLNALLFFSNIEVRHAVANIFIRYECFSYCLGDVLLSETHNTTQKSGLEILSGAENMNEHSEDDILHDIVLP